MNLVILSGYVGKDPDVTQVNGKGLAKFSLATNKTYKDKDGQKQTKTEWHSIVVWGQRAEVIGKYVKKGVQLIVQGEIQYSESERDGVKRYYTSIVMTDFEFIGGSKEVKEPKSETNQPDNQTNDLPF